MGSDASERDPEGLRPRGRNAVDVVRGATTVVGSKVNFRGRQHRVTRAGHPLIGSGSGWIQVSPPVPGNDPGMWYRINFFDPIGGDQ